MSSPFECPICCEIYNDIENIPTTFPCGHSCCLVHVNMLRVCFSCRKEVPVANKCLPTFSLRDGAILFQRMLDDRQYNPTHSENFSNYSEFPYIIALQRQIEMDERLARLLQQQDSLERNDFSTPEIVPPVQPASLAPPSIPIVQQQSSSIRSHNRNQQMKMCGHLCSFSSLINCCACMDRRPILSNNTYPIYVDGQGWKNIGSRKYGYCPFCR